MSKLISRTLVLNIWLIVMGNALLQAAAVDLAESFRKANVAYEEGNYKQAFAGYQALLTNGLRTAAIHFNLGNAAFKSDRVGDAIYHYRKARELTPRDADVKANLDFARDSINAVDPSQKDNVVLNYFTLGEVLAATIVLFWIMMLFCILRTWKPEWKSRLNPWLKISIILLFGAAVASLVAWQGTKPGQVVIIARKEAIARFGPLPESQTAYTIRDGAELLVSGKNDKWVQVRDNRGRTGWVPRGDVHLFP